MTSQVEALAALEDLLPATLDMTNSEAASRETLRQFIESAGADSDRYRELRGGKLRTTGSPRAGRIEVFRWQDRSEGEQLKGEALDAAIDAALAARSPQPGDGA